MNLSRDAFLSILIIFIFASCGANPGGGCAANRDSGQQFLGNQAPNFVLPDLRGKKIELTQLVSQKPVLLAFWATWCPTCVEEIPVLNEWTKKYPNLQILGINVQEPTQRIQKFIEKKKILYPVLVDEEAKVAQQFGLVGIPVSVLLAKGGRVIYYGFSLPHDVEQLIHE